MVWIAAVLLASEWSPAASLDPFTIVSGAHTPSGMHLCTTCAATCRYSKVQSCSCRGCGTAVDYVLWSNACALLPDLTQLHAYTAVIWMQK